MTFELLPAVVAGLAGTAAMTALMTMGRSTGMTSMDIGLLMGSMFTGDETSARRIGTVLHWMMGTVVFGIAYGLLFVALDSDAVVTGLLIGVVHALALGIVGLPMMGAIHPRMRAGGDLVLARPGFFGVGFGRGTPVGVLMGHAVFGAVVALVYSALT